MLATSRHRLTSDVARASVSASSAQASEPKVAVLLNANARKVTDAGHQVAVARGARRRTCSSRARSWMRGASRRRCWSGATTRSSAAAATAPSWASSTSSSSRWSSAAGYHPQPAAALRRAEAGDGQRPGVAGERLPAQGRRHPGRRAAGARQRGPGLPPHGPAAWWTASGPQFAGHGRGWQAPQRLHLGEGQPGQGLAQEADDGRQRVLLLGGAARRCPTT